MKTPSMIGLNQIDRLLDAAASERGFDISMARHVLALRRQRLRDGNRRRLFAALDQLFENPGSHALEKGSDASPEGGVVRLARLQLRNWKVFEHLDLAFPTFDINRPVVLIGGKNGYGKTSLMEGLLFGLFGREAVFEIGKTDQAGRAGVYRQRVQSALNRTAHERGDAYASVRSEWVTTEGKLAVERRWFFDDAGQLIPEDETLTLWVGDDGVPYAAPDEDVDPLTFLQEEVHRRLLTPSLAAFVFFDGEQVRRFANSGFSEQMQQALESVLGLSTWRAAAADLRDYARDRNRSAFKSDLRSGDAAAIARLVDERQRLIKSLDELAAKRAIPEPARDRLLAEIAGLEGGDYAGLHALLERQQHNRSEITRARHELAAVASQTIPALLTERLRASLQKRLAGEIESAPEISAMFENEDALRLLLENLDDDISLKARVKDGWTKARTIGTRAEDRRHGYMSSALQRAMVSRLAAGGDEAVLKEAVAKVETLSLEAEKLASQLASQKRRDERLGQARRELQEIRGSLALLDAETSVVGDRLTQLDQELNSLQAVSIDREQGLSISSVASDLSAQIEALIAEVLPHCFESAGTAVTDAYLALAHKGLVSRIEIDASGTVHLLDSQGHDVRKLDPSAGEAQVFAMALIGAMGTLVGERLPVIIDTPLGRLDPDHRRKILGFFTSRGRQTLLLSQPDEVGGQYLDLIMPRVAAMYRLDHEIHEGGLGKSVVQKGYFEEIAA